MLSQNFSVDTTGINSQNIILIFSYCMEYTKIKFEKYGAKVETKWKAQIFQNKVAARSKTFRSSPQSVQNA